MWGRNKVQHSAVFGFIARWAIFHLQPLGADLEAAFTG
jgi:hypothetical protein